MTRTPPRPIVMLLATLSIGAACFAEDSESTFTVAPPPVGYPDFKAGDATEQAGGGAVVVKTDFSGLAGWLVGGSGAWQYQYCPADGLALGASAAGSLMVGDRNGLVLMSAPLGIAVAAELFGWRGSTLYAFGYAGGTLGYNYMEVDAFVAVGPIPIVVNDVPTVQTLSGLVSAGFGSQANLALGGFVLSPFAQWTWSGGAYRTTMDSRMDGVGYPSRSGTIGLSMNSVYGFDLLYKPLGWSLSSQLRLGESYQMITIALRRLIGTAKARLGA